MQLTGDGLVTLLALSGTLSASYRFRMGEGLTVGRAYDCDLSIDDRFASRRHLRLDRTPEGLVLTDLGSANGTLLNGEPVTHAVLRSGDMIEIGSVELRVRIDQDIDDPTCGDCGGSLPHAVESATPTLCEDCHRPGPYALPDVDLSRRLEEEGYELVETLNRSGAVSVFRARRIAFRQPVIVKVLCLRGSVTRGQISRFVEGAHAQAPLRHRNISAVVDLRQCRDLLMLVTEELEGETLRRKLQRGGSRLSVNESLRICYQIGQALAHLYDRGVVHRDIRPDNIMIAPDGTAKLIDFGVAKSLSQTDPYAKTRFGESVGVPGYMAPEQIHTAVFADTRADIYGLGATLYHCLSGKPAAPQPVKGGKALGAPAIQPLLEVPREVVEIVLRMVQPKPQDRFPTPHALLGTIEELVGRMMGVVVDASNVELLLRLGDPEADLLLTPPQAYRLQPASFQGRIRDQELVEFLQMLEFHGKSGTLSVRAKGLQAEVEICDGQIADVIGIEGEREKALAQILSLRDGAFGFSPHLVGVQADRPTLRIGQMLLEHLRASDEARI